MGNLVRWCLMFVLCLCGARAVQADDSDYRLVSEAELFEAMDQVKGYDPTATTNGARFQADVMFALYDTVANSGRLDRPLFITPDDWFRAFLRKTDLTEDTAPQYTKLAHQNQQFMWVDMQMDHVIEKVIEGPQPVRAFNVMFWWPNAVNEARSYSYQDTLSTPNLNVTNHQVITYRLLDFGTHFFFDDIDGLTGRPTTGLLGVLFKLIGEGRVEVTGMAISNDGLQVVHGTAKKAFLGVTTTATISPSGKSEKDVPDGRPDLEALERVLETEFEMEYVPFGWSEDMDRLILKMRADN